jgi:cellulose biosynthesis protein BcsQ
VKLLVLDANTEAQAFCAKRIEQFSQSDVEMLDLKLKLVGEKDFHDKISEADVLVIGSGVGDRGITIARTVHASAPWLHIIMFVSDEIYGGTAFKVAHSAGVRKVFPDSASPLDFLQELIGIYSEFKRDGRTREGRVVVITHAKGGVGATSVAAALAEVCADFQRKTLLWDMDVETRDLSRSLTVSGVAEAKVVSAWVNGSREVSRDSLKDALIPISSDVSVLIPPDRMAESMDLVCHIDSISIVQRVVEISRLLFDVILVDTGGRMGPATGALLRAADQVLVVVDDTVLGLTAVDLYLNYVKSLIGSTERLVFLVNPYAGGLLSINQIAAELEPVHKLGEAPWRLPALPNDPKAAMWPGSGNTLYKLGQKATRNTLITIAKEIGVVQKTGTEEDEVVEPASSGGWLSRLFGKGEQSGTDE